MTVENVCSGMLPDVSEKSRTAEMPFTQPWYGLNGDTAKGHYPIVDYAATGCLTEHLRAIGGVIALFGNAVENRTEKDIVCRRFPFFRFSNGMA